jgi:uncharacterized protein
MAAYPQRRRIAAVEAISPADTTKAIRPGLTALSPSFLQGSRRLTGLGLAADRAHNRRMNIASDHPDHGFQFPGVFEITAMGPASAGLEERIPELLEAIGIVVLRETVAARNSSGGRFVSIRLSFHAEDRDRYEAAHAALRDEPDIKWTL